MVMALQHRNLTSWSEDANKDHRDIYQKSQRNPARAIVRIGEYQVFGFWNPTQHIRFGLRVIDSSLLVYLAYDCDVSERTCASALTHIWKLCLIDSTGTASLLSRRSMHGSQHHAAIISEYRSGKGVNPDETGSRPSGTSRLSKM
jgi:hypothetical protein